MGYIYKITNIQNKMMYIGQTIMDFQERIRHHFNKKSNCRYLANALEKYGKDNFKYEIICICFDEDLNRFEEEYITKYQTIVPNGYNLKSGGNSSRHNEETKKKISLSLKGRKILTPSPCLGRILTEEHKNLISLSVKKTLDGRPQGFTKMKEANKLKWRSIIKLDLEGNYVERFDNSVVAAKDVNSNKGSIHIACKTNKIHKNFLWFYEKDYLENLNLPDL
jgi:group I intron endonuclease